MAYLQNFGGDGALFVAVSEFHGVFSMALDFVTQILSLVLGCHSLFKAVSKFSGLARIAKEAK